MRAHGLWSLRIMAGWVRVLSTSRQKKRGLALTIPPTAALLLLFAVAIGLPYMVHKYVPGIKTVMPLAIIQILVGIALGPTIAGHFFPDVAAVMASPVITEIVSGLAKLGLVVFSYEIGRHMAAAFSKKKETGDSLPPGKVMMVAAASLVVPFAVSIPFGYVWGLNPAYLGAEGTAWSFMAALAIAASVTALPVLKSITSELGVKEKPLGQVALACALINDAVLWPAMALFLALLAYFSPVSQGFASLGWFVFWSLLYILVMWRMVRPLLAKMKPLEGMGAIVVPIAFAAVSGSVTEMIGLHEILGAVMAGMVMPAHAMGEQRERELVRFNDALLLPFFFIATGMKANIPLSADFEFWALAIGSTVLAIVTKFFPVAYVAMRTGLFDRPQAVKLGHLMCAKGLMEFVVLSILHKEGVLSDVSFGALVVMAILTTAWVKPAVMLTARYYRTPLGGVYVGGTAARSAAGD